MTNENFSIRANQKDMIYTLNAVQGESQSRTFKFQLKDSTGNTISPLGKTCSFYVTKPDGNIVMIPMTVDGDMALVTLTAQACSIAGYMPCWIQFVDPDGNDLRVDNMRLCIKECNFDAAVESSPEFSALEQALGNVTEMKVHMADHGNPHGVTAGQAGAISASERGVADGVATLDSNSKIPASQIPSLDYIPTTQKGVANGVATLDSSVKIPVSQIPSLDYIPTTQKGAASGVASLGSDGKIPVSQIPSLDYIQPDSVASLHGLVISRENEEPAPNNCIYSIATNGEYAHLISLTKSNHVCVAWGGDGVDSTDIYGGGDIIFRANHNQEFVANSLSMFREPDYLNRTIFRCDVDGGAFLGTATYRWNTAFFTNEITTSDLKEKEVIPDFDFKAKEFILGLKPIAYRRVGINDTGKRVHLGLGAQTLNQHIKDLALGDLSMVQASIIDGEQERPYYGEDIDDSQLSWGINYNELIAPMIKMLQEQQQQIDSLQAQVDELKRPQTSLETIKEE